MNHYQTDSFKREGNKHRLCRMSKSLKRVAFKGTAGAALTCIFATRRKWAVFSTRRLRPFPRATVVLRRTAKPQPVRSTELRKSVRLPASDESPHRLLTQVEARADKAVQQWTAWKCRLRRSGVKHADVEGMSHCFIHEQTLFYAVLGCKKGNLMTALHSLGMTSMGT
jgi:hypothetical protein